MARRKIRKILLPIRKRTGQSIARMSGNTLYIVRLYRCLHRGANVAAEKCFQFHSNRL